MPTSHRDFKDRLYAQFARVGKALARPHRIEMLELLAQRERTVDSLATEIGLFARKRLAAPPGVAAGGAGRNRKDGLFVYYRLADPAVFELCTAILE